MRTSATFIGTATVLLRLGGFTVLTDPNFLHRGQRAHLGYGLSSRRRTDPAMEPGQLPALDGIVLSHLHGDHFDRIARRRLPRDVPVITTRPAARPLTIGTILDWRHDEGERLRLYITGDTLFRARRLRDIPRRFGDIDAMLLHLGGTRILGALVTMDARQGLAMSRLIRPGVIVPIHYDDYTVFRDPLSNFLRAAAATELAGTVKPVVRGETVSLLPEPARIAG
jgi:L-ascorbate metabolism protein UlaG (beta-lactamase superfamily)